MKVCIIAGNYPSEGNQRHVFLMNLVSALVELGIECTVIAPQPFLPKWIKKYPARKRAATYETASGKHYRVYSPFFCSLGGKKMLGVKFGAISQRFFQIAAQWTFKRNAVDTDVLYAHFVQPAVTAHAISRKLGKPYYIANGESDLYGFFGKLRRKDILSTLRNAKGIISVSTANRNELIHCPYFPSDEKEKVIMLPNGIHMDRFRQIDRQEARKQLGLPSDCFIVAFVGSFIDRKGCLRLSKALDEMHDVYSLFIGSGPQSPTCKNRLHTGRVDNARMYLYLNAANVFVLPTINEGCCNAIIEAMACGLPVISSDLPFNDDILDASCSIRIDAMDHKKIQKAIEQLKDDQALCKAMSACALQNAARFSINERAKKIADFIARQ